MAYTFCFWLALAAFVVSVFLIFYSYALYPWLVFYLSRNKSLQLRHHTREDELPFVSIIIAAFNEEKVIREKLQTVFSSNYPLHKFEVLTGSDASEDDTNKIVEELAKKHANLRFFPFSERRGKGNVINDLQEHASGDIIVFTDANVMFEEDTLFEMVKYFKDEKVGLVDTRMINTNIRQEGISYQEKSYISREVKIKHAESILWGTMMGPFGGCFAIRRELFTPVPKNFLVDDFYINMKILGAGYQCINNQDARVYESVPDDLGAEFRRKKRIGAGNFQNLRAFYRMLWHKTPGLTFSYVSHKVIRWLGPFLMIIAFLSNIWLALYHPVFVYVLLLHCLLLFLPLLDYLLKKLRIHSRHLRFISHFYGMNLAMLLGFFKSFKKTETNVWRPTERST